MTMHPIDETKLLEDNVRRFAEGEIAPRLDAMNHYPDQPLPAQAVDGLRELGLIEWALPEEVGGDGAEDGLLATVVGALAETAGAPAALLLAHTLAQRLVVASGSAEGLASIGPGEGGYAPLLGFPLYVEPDDVGRGVRFEAEDEGFRVSGELEFVVNAPVAQRLVVPACDASAGSVGLLVVDTDARGVRIGEPLLTLGMRGGPVADVSFDGVHVARAALCAADALPLLRAEHARLRGPVAALCAGVVASSARAAFAYAQERYQGGRYIVDHPEVRRMLFELMADRDLCRDAARRLAESPPGEPEATELFVRAKEAAARATTDGVQLLGGYGYMEEYGQERRMRDAKQAQCLLGRTDVQRQQAFADFLAEQTKEAAQ